eukprot:5149180-Heterocapsa_arctica.AAC.1
MKAPSASSCSALEEDSPKRFTPSSGIITSRQCLSWSSQCASAPEKRPTPRGWYPAPSTRGAPESPSSADA